MLPYCLKCKKKKKKKKKILRVSIQKFLQLVMVKQGYYQSVLYVVLKNQNLLKTKKQKDF